MYAIAMSEKIGKVAESDFITLDENTIIADAVKLMRSKRPPIINQSINQLLI